MAKIDLPKRSGKRLKVREKSVKSQGILKMILSGTPAYGNLYSDAYQRINMVKFLTIKCDTIL